MRFDAHAWALVMAVLSPACGTARQDTWAFQGPFPSRAEAPEEVPKADPSRYPRPAADPARSWSKLGEARVDGRRELETVPMRDWDERFRVVRVRFDPDHIRIRDVVLELDDGTILSMEAVQRDEESMTFDVPPEVGSIRAVHFHYTDLRGGRPVRVDVWGR